MAKASKVSPGDRVAVHYTGTLDDGQVFDSSEDRDPLEFTVGAGDVIPGFEAAVLGMLQGQEKTVTLPPDQAYGDYDPELVIEGPRERFPKDVTVGQSYHFHLAKDEEADGIVKEIRTDTIVVDFNHPLAGKRLTFRLKLLRVA